MLVRMHMFSDKISIKSYSIIYIYLMF